MRFDRISFTALAAGLCLALAAVPAQAGPGKGKDKKGGHPAASAPGPEDAAAVLVGAAIQIITGHDREILEDYLAKEHGGGCPPGLAKKNNGCLPPGIAKKYAVGEKLPPGVRAHDLPRSLLDLLKPPKGHRFARVDDDIVLIAEATGKIVDAVTLLAAVNGK